MGTIEVIDGFDEYPVGQMLDYGWSSGTTSFVTGRFGGQAARVGNNTISRVLKGDTRYTVSFAARDTTLANAASALISLQEGATIHATLRYVTDGTLKIYNGAGSLLATTAAVITNASAWYHIEFDYKVGDADGEYELRVDGVSAIARATGVDTRNGGTNGIIDNIKFTTPTSCVWDFDDMIFTKGGGFQGDCRVITQLPSADGANDSWSRVELPRLQAVGASVTGAAAVSPVWPTHEPGDIALLFVESAGGEIISLSTEAGFAEVTNSPQATGAGTAGTRLAVYWCRATSSAMSTPTVSDPGDHVYARIVTFRGCLAAGSPIDITSGGVKASATTSVTATGVTTTQANDLVVVAVSWDLDNAGPLFSGWTNANLDGLAEIFDEGSTSNNGGGIGVVYGIKATAGATGDTTATVTSSVNAFLTIALKGNTAKYSAVDDPVSHDSDTSYIVSGTPGDRQTFDFPNLGVTGTIRAVQITTMARKDDAGTRKLASVVRRGTTNYDGTAVPLSASYVAVDYVYEQDPSTSAAWTVSNIDAGEFGIKVDS